MTDQKDIQNMNYVILAVFVKQNSVSNPIQKILFFLKQGCH